MSKYRANRGVPRNKKPLRNIVYKFSIIEKLKEGVNVEKLNLEQYRFKDMGFILMSWNYEGDSFSYSHGFITPDQVKNILGAKQWGKFCEGKRDFIIQRRIDGKNIKI